MSTMSNLQLELLRLYAGGVSEKALREIKDLIARYFAERASDEFDAFAEAKGLTGSDLAAWADEHDRAENRPRH